MVQVCKGCAQEKNIEEFNKCTVRKAGYETKCKECRRLRRQQCVLQRPIYLYSTKKCNKCGDDKDLGHFSRSYLNKDGKTNTCRSCISLYTATRPKTYVPRPKKVKTIVAKVPKQRLSDEQRRLARNERNRVGRNKLRRSDINFRLRQNLRSRLTNILKGKGKAGSAIKDLGCDWPSFKEHIQQLWADGMTWENYGHGVGKWVLDHIMPLSVFDLTNRQHLLLACHYLNIQPLWHDENMRKSDSIPYSLFQIV